MGILARRVQFVAVVSVLDCADSQTAALKLADQLAHERCLTVVLAPDDMYSLHLPWLAGRLEWRDGSLRRLRDKTHFFFGRPDFFG